MAPASTGYGLARSVRFQGQQLLLEETRLRLERTSRFRSKLASNRMPTIRYEAANLDGSEMVLEREGGEVCIRVGPRTLMASDAHDSEDELGRLIASAVGGVSTPRVLIGGLGLGFTLRAALDALPPAARVDVVELVPDVVRWNREDCGVYAGRPLDDERVTVLIEDVAAVIARSEDSYDGIALDVDNGPSAVTHRRNEQLYRRAGLVRAYAALRAGGVLAVWSSFPSELFTRSLEELGGAVELVVTRAGVAPEHYIWLVTKPGA